MQGYAYSDNLLIGILSRLKNLNDIHEETLSCMNAQQQNQVTSLRELGVVTSTPQNSALGTGSDSSNPRPEPVLLQSIVEQLDRLDANLGFAKNQLEDAKFIGEALYRQFANPKQQGSIVGAMANSTVGSGIDGRDWK